MKSTGSNGARVWHTYPITRASRVHAETTTNDPVPLSILNNLFGPNTMTPYALNFKGEPLH